MSRKKLWTVAIILLGVAVGVRGWREPSIAVEYTIYALLIAALVRNATARERLRGLPERVQLAIGLCFLLLLSGQLTRDSRYLFPFIRWSMFVGVAAGDSSYYEYFGYLGDGTTKRFMRDDWSPRGGAALLVRLHPLASAANAGDDRSRSGEKVGLLSRTLRRCADVYNRDHPSDPIRAVEVVRRTVPLRSYDGPGSIRRESILRFPLDEGD